MPRLVVFAVLGAALLGAVVVVVRARATTPVPIAVVEETAAPTAAPSFVYVDVGGAVLRPGVVRLSSGTRVGDAIAAAGGAAPEADMSVLNRAALLCDGARVYVPRVGETPPAGSVGSDAETSIDLNHASAAELESLPGIGPATAARIMRSRDAHPFAKLEDLQTRGLVTARVLADIRDLLTLR